MECCTCRVSARLHYTSLRRYAHAPRARGRRTFFVASNFDKAKERSVGALKARPRSDALKARPRSDARVLTKWGTVQRQLSGSALLALHCCSFVRIFAKTEGAVTAGRGRSLRPIPRKSWRHGMQPYTLPANANPIEITTAAVNRSLSHL